MLGVCANLAAGRNPKSPAVSRSSAVAAQVPTPCEASVIRSADRRRSPAPRRSSAGPAPASAVPAASAGARGAPPAHRSGTGRPARPRRGKARDGGATAACPAGRVPRHSRHRSRCTAGPWPAWRGRRGAAGSHRVASGRQSGAHRARLSAEQKGSCGPIAPSCRCAGDKVSHCRETSLPRPLACMALKPCDKADRLSATRCSRGRGRCGNPSKPWHTRGER